MDEDDVRAWHAGAESRGGDLEKSWAVGGRMIAQFDDQDTESEESE